MKVAVLGRGNVGGGLGAEFIRSKTNGPTTNSQAPSSLTSGARVAAPSGPSPAPGGGADDSDEVAVRRVHRVHTSYSEAKR